MLRAFPKMLIAVLLYNALIFGGRLTVMRRTPCWRTIFR